ncbi:MAG: deoxyribonuclease IV [Peptococcales bacterium]|jgi:deoxyribonuclease-4
MLIGAHMTIGKGLSKAIRDAISIDGSTMQIFTRNPRGGQAKSLDSKDLEKGKNLVKESGFGPWVAHTPYTINFSSSKPDIREFGINTIIEDFSRMDKMGADFLVLHAGSHVGQGEKVGEDLFVKGLNTVLPYCPSRMFLLIEVMAGQGTELGSSLEKVQKLIERVEDDTRLGLCLDTCHLFAAGYNVSDWGKFWTQLSSIIDQEKVKVLHLNDSKFPLGSHKDRHAALGQGEIGLEGIKNIVLHPSIRNIPIILETPNDLAGWAEEIKMIKKWWQKAGILDEKE